MTEKQEVTGRTTHMNQTEARSEAAPESTIDWLNRLVGGSVGSKSDDDNGRSLKYLFRPNLNEPQLLIPIGNRSVTAATLRRFHDSRSRLNTVVSAASPILGDARLLPIMGGETATVGPFDLVDELAIKLGEPELLASVILGPKRRNRKPVLQLIRPDGVVVGFAKIGWSSLTTQLVANERDILLKVESHLPERIEAPRVLLHETRPDPDGRVIVVSSALSNGPLPKRQGPLSLDFVTSLARSVSGGTVPVKTLPYLAGWLQNETLRPFVEKVVEVHGETELEVGLWHGDLTPWNTSTTKKKMVIWDWEFAGLGRPVGFDLLHDIFETERRSDGVSVTSALATTARDGAYRLEGLTSATDAILDLYLCELLHRETELEGQRWESTTVGTTDAPLLTFLSRRLGFEQ